MSGRERLRSVVRKLGLRAVLLFYGVAWRCAVHVALFIGLLCLIAPIHLLFSKFRNSRLWLVLYEKARVATLLFVCTCTILVLNNLLNLQNTPLGPVVSTLFLACGIATIVCLARAVSFGKVYVIGRLYVATLVEQFEEYCAKSRLAKVLLQPILLPLKILHWVTRQTTQLERKILKLRTKIYGLDTLSLVATFT